MTMTEQNTGLLDDAGTTGERILEVRDLKTYFHTAAGIAKAVDGVSFSLDRGKTLAIVGESGSGKSVTASSVIRLLAKTGKIEGGSIEFDGIDMVHVPERELLKIRGSDISMIFQDPMSGLDSVFKVGTQMVELIRAHSDLGKKEAYDRAVEMLRLVGIPDPAARMDAYPYELSGGMCQRVIIAMAVSCHPKFIIADEPTTALDVTVQSQVLSLLRGLQDELGTAILLITHNLGIVWEMANDVMVMYAGRTCEYTSMEELYSNPLHPYTWGLLDSMPRLSDTAKTASRPSRACLPTLGLPVRAATSATVAPMRRRSATSASQSSRRSSPGTLWRACDRTASTGSSEAR